MSEKLEQMRAHLHTKLDAVVDQLEAAKANIETAPKEAGADILAKLESTKTNLEAKKQEVDAAKARIKELVDDGLVVGCLVAGCVRPVCRCARHYVSSQLPAIPRQRD